MIHWYINMYQYLEYSKLFFIIRLYLMKFIIKKILQYKTTIIQFIVFGLIGLVGIWIHLSITYIFTEYLWIYYLISYYIGQFLWMTNNFIWNKYITFKKRDWKYLKQYILSIIFYSIIAILSGGVVYLFTDYLWIWYITSIIITIPLVSLINFISHKYVVFKS